MKSKSPPVKGLKRIQSLLWDLITAPESPLKILSDNESSHLPIAGDARLTALKRLDIYANMYFFRILEALRSDYPALAEFLGPKRFHNLITDYLITHPSTHYSIRFVGQHLPKYLSRHAFNRQHRFLADLAQYEWSLLQVFDAADAPVLSLDHLRKTPPDQWEALPLKTIPACVFMIQRYPVAEIRKTILAKRTLTLPEPKREYLLVWRKGAECVQRQISSLEYGLLQRLKEVAPFKLLCELLAQKKGAGQATFLMAKYLQQWIQEGLLDATRFNEVI